MNLGKRFLSHTTSFPTFHVTTYYTHWSWFFLFLFFFFNLNNPSNIPNLHLNLGRSTFIQSPSQLRGLNFFSTTSENLSWLPSFSSELSWTSSFTSCLSHQLYLWPSSPTLKMMYLHNLDSNKNYRSMKLAISKSYNNGSI